MVARPYGLVLSQLWLNRGGTTWWLGIVTAMVEQWWHDLMAWYCRRYGYTVVARPGGLVLSQLLLNSGGTTWWLGIVTAIVEQWWHDLVAWYCHR